MKNNKVPPPRNPIAVGALFRKAGAHKKNNKQERAAERSKKSNWW